jgi:lysophospholipase L1-like esterase
MKNQRARRLKWILLVGVLLIVSTLAYVEFFYRRPTGEGPAGPAVAASAFASVWSARSVELVGIGDSVTAGLGAATPEHSYFARLLANPSDEYSDMVGRSLSAVFPNLRSENLAVSGSTSMQHADTIRDRLAQRDPDVFGIVVMTTGGNDLIHWYGRGEPRECAMYGATLAQAEPWIASFARRLSSMLDEITARFPGGCEIYLANIYDPTDGVGDAPSIMLPHWQDGLAIHARYNAIIEKAAASRSHVHLVPLYETFLGHGSHCRQPWLATYDAKDPHYWFYTNIEDPNDRGYDAIRRVFLNTIAANTLMLQPEDAELKNRE